MEESKLPLSNSAILKTTMFSGVAFSFTTTCLARIDQDQGLGEAILYASFVTLVTIVLWAVAIRIIPELQSRYAKICAVICLLVMCLFIANVSGLQNQIKLAGSQSLGFERERIADVHGDSLRAASENGTALRELIPILRAQSQTYGERAQSEYHRGEYTTVPGTGFIYDSLAAFSIEFGKLADQIEGQLEKVDDLRAQGAVIAATMRRDARANGQHNVLMERLEKSSEAAHVLIGKLNSKGEAIALKFAVENMEGELTVRTQLSSNPNTAALQKAAIRRIHGELDASAAVIQPYIDAFLEADPVILPRIERINVQQAVMRHWDKSIPELMMSLGVDCWPVLYLIFAMIFLGDRGTFHTEAQNMNLARFLNQYQVIRTVAREIEDDSEYNRVTREIAEYRDFEGDTGDGDVKKNSSQSVQRPHKHQIYKSGGDHENR
jgi:hypothetical protein